jgi:hypothetical protein
MPWEIEAKSNHVNQQRKDQTKWIYQPVCLVVRDEIRSEECSVSQLKFKADPEEEAA